MHEMSIAQELIRQIEEHVSAERRPSVRNIALRIGTLSSILPESLTFCFDALVNQTLLQSAKLSIELVPYTLHCTACNHSFEPEGWAHVCPKCGSSQLISQTGQELELAYIELEESPSEVV